MDFILAMYDLHANKIDLNLLTALDALLSERNVTKAATRVGLSQSAMSHKLRRLRDLFEDELLVGGRAGMVPTERALALAEPVRRGLLELQSALLSVEDFDPATARRRFTIGSTDYADFVILPRVLDHLARHAPGITLRIEPLGDRMVESLEDGTIDLVMGIALQGSALRQRPVYDEGFMTIAREGHPALDGDGELDLPRYLELGHVMMSKDDSPGLVDEALARVGHQRRVVLSTPYFVPIPFIVAGSDLVATIPRALAVTAATRAPLRLLVPPVPLPTFRIMATWHERSHRDPAHQWLRDLSRRLTIESLAQHGYREPDEGPVGGHEPEPATPGPE